MASEYENNKRIAKNTLLLYLRMIVMMIISLYTSRVLLDALGVEDYGIYNAVGGIVAMFSMLSGSLSAAISRFITYELGTGNASKIKQIFSASITTQIILSLIVVAIAETLGFWFLENKMVIPEVRMNAAFWCFQLSELTFVINLISVPYNAAIIAHEKMNAFAYISIFESSIKLVIAFVIAISSYDKLIFYAVLLTLLSLVIRVIYGAYCRKHFEECSFSIAFNAKILKEMFGFAGWNSIGAASWVLKEHGASILLNLFFGPTVNAARAVASKVNVVVSGFAQNFTTALNPQIIKSYASNDFLYMFKLMDKGIRLSFFLLMAVAFPLLFNTQYILGLWLVEVPQHTVAFVQLILISSLVEIISNPLITIMLATGKIKKYQIIVGSLQMMNFPCSYVVLKLGANPETVVVVAIVFSLACFVSRVVLLKGLVRLNVVKFVRDTLGRIVLVCALTFVLPMIVGQFLDTGFLRFVVLCAAIELSVTFFALYIGCSKDERQFICKKIVAKVKS